MPLPPAGRDHVALITSAGNARIKEARKLAKPRERRKRGELLVEGVRLIDDALRTGVLPHVFFFLPEALTEGSPGYDLLVALKAAGVDCLPCAPAAFAALAETTTPQGAAAVLPLPACPWPAWPTLLLILDAVRDPGNAGTLLRSAEAAGTEAVIAGPETVDLFNDKVLRAGMGAHFRLPLAQCRTWDEVDARLSGQTIYVADAAADLAYDAVDWRQPAALVVGGEAGGAGREARRRAVPVAIPMRGQAESLNAGVAGAVILFEAARQRRAARALGGFR